MKQLFVECHLPTALWGDDESESRLLPGRAFQTLAEMSPTKGKVAKYGQLQPKVRPRGFGIASLGTRIECSRIHLEDQPP